MKCGLLYAKVNRSYGQGPQRVTLPVYNVLRRELQAGALALLTAPLDGRVLKDLDDRR